MHHDVADDFEGVRVNGKHIAGGLAGDVEKFAIGTRARAFGFAADGDEGQTLPVAASRTVAALTSSLAM